MNAPERARWPLKAALRVKSEEKGEELGCVNFILSDHTCTRSSQVFVVVFVVVVVAHGQVRLWLAQATPSVHGLPGPPPVG